MALRGWFAGALVVALVFSSAWARAQSGPEIRSQGGGQTLEIAPNIASQNPQQSMPRPEDNTRVIPVIPPSQRVLTLPQASRDFLGKWGGHLHLARKYGDAQPPEKMVEGMLFGERNGQVVLATYIYGGRDMNVLQAHAESDGPRTVTLTEQSVDISSRPPIRQVSKLTMELTAGDRLKCTNLVDFYVTGISEPLAEAEFEGELKIMTPEEEQMLADEVQRSGKVPVAKIEQGNPPPQDQY